MAVKTDAKLARRLRNLASIVQRAETGRTGATQEGSGRNWRASEAAARGNFEAALVELVAIEDAQGVEAAAAGSDRLTALRQRAMAVGLLTAEDVLKIERRVTE